uniref:Uncharacterized protein n=1 Tax=Arundo donax TaxID=35708 RepID=A0A0A9GFN5_ARUDO
MACCSLRAAASLLRSPYSGRVSRSSQFSNHRLNREF